MRFSKLSVGAAVAVAGVSLAGSALAQEAEGSASGEVGMTLPGAVPAGPAAGAAAGDSDHDQMIGRFGVGYMGRVGVPIADTSLANPPAGMGLPTRLVPAPVIGMRYWLDQRLGLDVGIGFYSDGGTDKDPNNSADRAGTNAFALHAGVPLALAGSKHFSFQIVPELNVGFAQQSYKPPVGGGELKNSGFGLDIGARAGAEIHFGFIGIPELSLQGSVGILFTQYTVKSEAVPAAGATQTYESSGRVLSTTVYDNPWNIFTSNVAALYYF